MTDVEPVDFTAQRNAKRIEMARKALTPELAAALLENPMRERELNGAFLNGCRVIDLILANVVVRTNNGIRYAKEAVDILSDIKNGR
jgi:hypothetical protein